MKQLNFMGEVHQLLTPQEEFISNLERQFGKKDAEVFFLSPEKYKHHFDAATLAAYQEFVE